MGLRSRPRKHFQKVGPSTSTTSSRTASPSARARRSSSPPTASTTWTSRPRATTRCRCSRPPARPRASTTRPARRSGSTASPRRLQPRAGPAEHLRQEALLQRQEEASRAACRWARLKPMTVNFKKKGKFTYYCDVHPGMKGVVTVKGKKAKVPSTKADKKAAQEADRAQRQDRQDARRGHAAGQHGRHRRRRQARRGVVRLPAEDLTVPVGTTVKFRMSAGSYEVHTATAGPGDPGARDGLVPAGDRRVLRGRPVIDPRGVLPERGRRHAGGPDPGAARQRVLELRRAGRVVQRLRRCPGRTRSRSARRARTTSTAWSTRS